MFNSLMFRAIMVRGRSFTGVRRLYRYSFMKTMYFPNELTLLNVKYHLCSYDPSKRSQKYTKSEKWFRRKITNTCTLESCIYKTYLRKTYAINYIFIYYIFIYSRLYIHSINVRFILYKAIKMKFYS